MSKTLLRNASCIISTLAFIFCADLHLQARDSIYKQIDDAKEALKHNKATLHNFEGFVQMAKSGKYFFKPSKSTGAFIPEIEKIEDAVKRYQQSVINGRMTDTEMAKAISDRTKRTQAFIRGYKGIVKNLNIEIKSLERKVKKLEEKARKLKAEKKAKEKKKYEEERKRKEEEAKKDIEKYEKKLDEQIKKEAEDRKKRKEERKKKELEEEKKREEEDAFAIILQTAQGLVSQARSLENGMASHYALAKSSAQQAQQNGARIQGLSQTINQIPNLMAGWNQLAQQVAALSGAISGTPNLSGSIGPLNKIMNKAVTASSNACKLASLLANSNLADTKPKQAMSVSKKANGAALEAQSAAASIAGIGSQAQSYATQAEAQFNELHATVLEMNRIKESIQNLTKQVSNAQSSMEALNRNLTSIQSIVSQLSENQSQILTLKNSALDLLASYSNKARAQSVIVQANALGLSQGTHPEQFLQNVQAALGSAQGEMAKMSSYASTALPSAPSISGLLTIIANSKIAAEQIVSIEAKAHAKAQKAKNCAKKASAVLGTIPEEEEEEDDDDDKKPQDVPPWFIPAGESVAGPKTPNGGQGHPGKTQGGNKKGSKTVNQGGHIIEIKKVN